MSEIRCEHPRLGMKFHGFLVKFWLFVTALVSVLGGGLQCFVRGQPLVLTRQDPWTSAVEVVYIGRDWLIIALGVAMILLGLFALWVQRDLKRLRGRAPWEVFLLYALLAAVYLVRLVFRFIGEWLPVTLPFLILSLALAVAVRVYYNKRDFLFTN